MIDIQNGFLSETFGKRYDPYAEKRISEIVNYFRQNKQPVNHVVIY
ncbi:hypothetical protein SGGBAA2069_c19370 [Streptococcus gallolyticus subsp. gallolyticus ATCC BAA-2069]|nr:hypothetical protein BTR42_10620 [Streptococcus gallolyticus subsp. gallolyticus DSM 16831]CBZ49109.1 hypothetical protein SGGBAA2069_c19370 [Streptococcus gallolyticus subsp. gallolyticus ATCC BAA-2069]